MVVIKKGGSGEKKGGGDEEKGSGHGVNVGSGGGGGRSSPHFVYIVCKYEH